MSFNLPHKLLGRFVDLELLDEVHREDLRIIAQDESIWTYFPYDASGNNFDAWFDKASKHTSERQQIAFAVRCKKNHTVVGSTRCYDISLKNRRLAIGHTWYSKEVRGTSVNPETKLLLLTYVFETLDINRVEFFADARNLRSLAALKKLGAYEEGILRQHLILEKDGYIRDSAVFSILKSEWHKIKQKLLHRLSGSNSRLV